MPPVSDLVGRGGKTAWNPNKKSPSQVLSNACQHVCALREVQFGNCFVDPHEEVRVWTWIWAMSGKEWTSLVAQLVKNRQQCRRLGFYPWTGKISWRREKLPIPVFWPGESHGLYSPWDHKELDRTEWLLLFTFFLGDSGGQWSLVCYSPRGRK